MIIKSLRLSLIRLPFRVSYGHKKKTHKEVFAVICQAEDEDGHYGLGEAVPRTYVTGETASSVFQEAQRLGKTVLGQTFTSRDDIQNHMLALTEQWPAESAFPSCAFCCVDLALHDCLAKYQSRNMADYMSSDICKLSYTASVGLSNKAKLMALLSLYRLGGIRFLKLKVGDEHDIERLELIKNFMGSDVSVFADANGAWPFEEAVSKIESLAQKGIWAIEEPLPIPDAAKQSGELQTNRDALMDDSHFEQYARLREKISTPVILDESLISPRSFRKIINHNAADILNIRLSKLGGYSLADHLLSETPEGIKFSFGAMVGESPILASAGYFFGCAHPSHLYIQGYSHRILHSSKFVVGGPVMKRGLVLGNTQQTGLGLTIKSNNLEKLTLKTKVLIHGKT